MNGEILESSVLKNLVYIMQKTSNIGLLNVHLIQSGVILPVEKEIIESHSPQETQVYHLMMLLLKKGPETKDKLLKALKETCNGHIASLLESNNPNDSATTGKSEISQKFTLDLDDTLTACARINPLLDKVQELVDILRLEDIAAASKVKLISVKEDVSNDGKKHVHVSAVEAPKKQESSICHKITVIGDGATGKTCLNIVWTTGVFPKEYIPTVFDNYPACLKVDGELIDLCIWDTAGQEAYERLRPLSYPLTDVCVIVFSLVSYSSLHNVVAKWVPEIKYHCPGVPIVVVGNKLDLRNNDKHAKSKDAIVSYKQGNAIAEKIKARAYFECSAFTGEGMKDVLPCVLRMAKEKKDNSANMKVCCCRTV